MSIPVSLAAASGAGQGPKLQRSLRFRSSASAYLSRTNVASPTNNKIFTFSAWIKRGQLSSSAPFPIISGGPDTNNFFDFFFDGDSLNVSQYSGGTYQLRYNTVNAGSGAVFRDVSAWYHIVLAIDMTQASGANGVKLYVNNVQQTWNYTAAYVQNSSMYPNTGSAASKICLRTAGTNYFDGYLAEVNFIDGQALTPSSFGQTDAVTGVWQPTRYTGTYGTNGFYLPFTDNTSATTLAYDKSGNGNNWTANNISTTAGATYDSMTDVPTLTGVSAANYCTLNPLDSYDYSGGAVGTYVTDANLKLAWTATAGQKRTFSTIAMPTSGKWYFEVQVLTTSANSNNIGISPITTNTNQNLIVGAATGEYAFDCSDGTKRNESTVTAYGTAPSTNDVVMCAVDIDNAKIWWGKQGTWFASGDPAAGTNAAFTTLSQTVQYKIGGTVRGAVHAYNFGQRPFSYTPPTGFVALNTFNLPDPTIKKPNQYMDATTYTGTGSALSVTNAAGFQPDFVWVKGRSGATDHALYDAVRGVQKQLESNTTTAETTETTGLTAFNSNGFSVGALAQMNTNAATYVGWQWKESVTAGFDIVTYTGTGSNTTVAHSLGVAPKMIIVKNRDNGTEPWFVYHASANASPATGAVFLNQTTAFTTGATYWNNTAPTASVFSVGTNTGTNQNTSKMLAYLFAEIAGFSKFGSYSGNASTDGVFVYCGFRPEYVMAKRSSTTSSWYIYDAARNTYNQAGARLFADSSAVEATDGIDFLSNGFKLRDAGGANSAGTWIFAAFAQNPFKFANAR